jgi:O-antigen/teichoic acid export membrane protein
VSIAKKSTYDFVSQLVILAFTFVSGVAVAVILGPKVSGVFRLVLFCNLICVNLANLGIGIANTYYLGKDRTKLAELHSLSVCLIIGITLVVLGVVLVSGEWLRHVLFRDVSVAYLLIAMGLFPFTLYYAVWVSMLIGLGEIKLLSIFNATYYAVQSVLFIFILLILRLWLTALLISWAVVQILAVGWMVYILSRWSPLWVPVNWALVKRVLRFGTVAHIGNVASTLLGRVDWLVISNRIGDVGIGYYGLATSLAEKVWLVAASMEKASYSSVTGAEKPEACELTKKIFRNTFFISGTIVVLLLLVSYPLIGLVYTKEYLPSLFPFRVLLCGAVFFGGCRIFAIYFTGHKGKPRIATTIAWVMLAVKMPLVIWLTVVYGIGGTAVATTGMYIVMFIVYFTLFVRDSGLRRLQEFFVITREDLAAYRDVARRSVQFLRDQMRKIQVT